MAVTMADIQRFLDIEDLNYISDPSKNIICIPFPVQGDQVNVFIIILEEGEYIIFRTPWFVDASKAVDREALFSKLLNLQNKFKLGRFVLDPETNEIALESCIAVEDGELTLNQVRRHLGAVVQIIAKFRQSIRMLANEGVFYDLDQDNDFLQKLIEGCDAEDEDDVNYDEFGCEEELGGKKEETTPPSFLDMIKAIWKTFWH